MSGWLGLVLAGCASAPSPAPVTNAAPAPLRTGRAFYELLSPQPEPGVLIPGTGPTGEEYVPAYASPDNAPPHYPTAALAAGCGQGRIVLRVRLDRHGGVEHVQDSPRGAAPEGACAALFRGAAEETLRGWRFAPARRQYRVAGLDLDHDGVPDLPRWESEPLETEADIQFRFEVELHTGHAPGVH